MIYAELVGGLVLLVAGGDLLVRGAVAIARRLSISPLLIGLTLVGFGTSTPELVTSVEAALLGSPGIAVGNVVGSNIANILLILGVAALIQPIRTARDAVRRDGGAVLLAALLCIAAALFGQFDRPIGSGYVLLLIGYVIFTYRRERIVDDASAAMHRAEANLAEPAPAHIAVSSACAAGGLALTVAGASLLVDGAIGLARAVGISESVVGLTVVAVGTSLPELVTSIVAAVRKHADVALGNIMGSNIYNVLGILGLTAIVVPIPVPPEIVRFDIWIMLAATMLMLAFAFSGWRLSRTEGGLFLLGYLGYVAYLAASAGGW